MTAERRQRRFPWAFLLTGTFVIIAAVTVLLVTLYQPAPPSSPSPAEQDQTFLNMLESRGTIPVTNPTAAVYYGRQVCANLDRGYFLLPTSVMELAPLDSNWATQSAVLTFCPRYKDAALKLPS